MFLNLVRLVIALGCYDTLSSVLQSSTLATHLRCSQGCREFAQGVRLVTIYLSHGPSWHQKRYKEGSRFVLHSDQQ